MPNQLELLSRHMPLSMCPEPCICSVGLSTCATLSIALAPLSAFVSCRDQQATCVISFQSSGYLRGCFNCLNSWDKLSRAPLRLLTTSPSPSLTSLTLFAITLLVQQFSGLIAYRISSEASTAPWPQDLPSSPVWDSGAPTITPFYPCIL
jgi:hypothetical protein